jgi:hypothetical protein
MAALLAKKREVLAGNVFEMPVAKSVSYCAGPRNRIRWLSLLVKLAS